MPNTAGVCEAPISWTAPTASDNCSATLTSTHASGDVFPVGTTAVTYTATDGVNSVSQSFLITVTDEEDPAITCAPNESLSAEVTFCGAIMPSYSPLAFSDNCAVDSIWQSGGPLLGDTLDLSGSPYFAQWSVVDLAGRTSSCTQRIDVVDVDAPVVICPLPAVVLLPGDANCEAVMPQLSDSMFVTECGTYTVVQSPAEGTTVNGPTTVTSTFTDASGNVTDVSDEVDVLDMTPPVFNCNLSTSYNADPGQCGTMVTLPSGIDVDTLISDV
ncbi:MAG: HYR domain-containing protein [Flavobacteriales bacterium]|nr:HYR domain-containing protein [Flavobacteriales bacterium]